MNYYTEARGYLESLLQNPEEVDSFIEAHRETLSKMNLVYTYSQNIQIKMAKDEAAFQQEAEQTKSACLQKLRLIHQQMLDINAGRQQISQTINADIDVLTEQVHNLVLTGQSDATNVSEELERVKNMYAQHQKELASATNLANTKG